MAKKKVTEQADSTFAVAPEDFTIVWEGAFYNFEAGNPVAIPTGLFEYLYRNGKVYSVTTEVEELPVEEPVAIEPEVVEVVEESTEEDI